MLHLSGLDEFANRGGYTLTEIRPWISSQQNIILDVLIQYQVIIKPEPAENSRLSMKQNSYFIKLRKSQNS